MKLCRRSNTHAALLLAALLVAGPVCGQGFSKTETITYHDNVNLWVLGQVESVLTSGVPTSQTVYDGPTALPIVTYSYGNLTPTRQMTWHLAGSQAPGQLKTVTDGNGHTVKLHTWKRGVPTAIEFPATPDQSAGALRTASVDDYGQVTAITDENNYTTNYGYDPQSGRLANISPPTGDTTAWNAVGFGWTKMAVSVHGIAAGHWRHSRQEGSKHINVHYDALLRPVYEESFDATASGTTGSQVAKRYDAQGRLIFESYPMRGMGSVTDPNLKGVRTLYDALGRVYRVEQDAEAAHGVLVTTTEYLPGFRTRRKLPNGQVTGAATVTSYMAWDKPNFDFPVRIEAPEGVITAIERNVFGRARVIRRGNAGGMLVERRNVYNAAQQVCKTIEPETGTTVLHYDGAGNLDWSAAGLDLPDPFCDYSSAGIAGRKVMRTYDARNRLKTLAFPDGNGNQWWNYYPDNLPSQVRTWNIPAAGVAPKDTVNTFEYNKKRLLRGEKMIAADWGVEYALGNEFDGNGNVSAQWYPSGHVVSYAPNGLGQPTLVSSSTAGVTYAQDFEYYPNGAAKKFRYGDGTAYEMLQNTRQLPYVVASENVNSYRYEYDANGNPTNIHDVDDPANRNRLLLYDDLDRMVAAGSPVFGGTHWQNYTYDVLDNIQTWVSSGRNDRYCYDGLGRLEFVRSNTSSCAAGGARLALGYDVQGNVSFRNNRQFTFDFGNRLREASAPGAIERYRYDAAGRRTLASRIDGPAASLGVIWSQYASSGQLMYQVNHRPEAAKSTDYIYLGGSLLAQRELPLNGTPGAIRFHHTDALGSPVATRTTVGGVAQVDRTDYEPYGRVISGATVGAPGYTGHMLDQATGLNYMQQRYYDPELGRFLSVDPISASGLTGGNFNRYWYAANAPHKFVDPDGRWVCAAGSDCGNFEKGLEMVADAAQSQDLSASERSTLQQSVDFYGKKGDPGVSISFANLGGAHGNATDKAVTLDMGAATRSNENDSLNALAKVIAHEGDHGWRIRSGDSKKMPRLELETHGYFAQAFYQKAAKFMDWPGSNGWTSTRGIDADMIGGQARLSTVTSCGTLTGCD